MVLAVIDKLADFLSTDRWKTAIHPSHRMETGSLHVSGNRIDRPQIRNGNTEILFRVVIEIPQHPIACGRVTHHLMVQIHHIGITSYEKHIPCITSPTAEPVDTSLGREA